MRPGKLLIIPSIFFFSGFSFATTQPLVTIGELEAQQNRNILYRQKFRAHSYRNNSKNQMLLHHLKLFQVSLV